MESLLLTLIVTPPYKTDGADNQVWGKEQIHHALVYTICYRTTCTAAGFGSGLAHSALCISIYTKHYA